MRKIIGRKGDLTQNVLSLIIAALGIALLVFAAYKLYRANVENEEENATKLLDSLDEKIKNLKDGEIGRFPIRGVNGWYLTGWGKDEQGRPDKCFFNSCVCVCKGSGKVGPNDLRKDECQNKGICKKAEKDKIIVQDFFEWREGVAQVYAPIPVRQLGTGEYSAIINNFTKFENKLYELAISKKDSELGILHYTEKYLAPGEGVIAWMGRYPENEDVKKWKEISGK